MAAKVSRGLGKGLDSLIPMGSVSSEKKADSKEENKESKDSKATETVVKKIGRASCRERVSA